MKLMKYIEKHSLLSTKEDLFALMDLIRSKNSVIDEKLESVLMYHTKSTQHALLKQLLSSYRSNWKPISRIKKTNTTTTPKVQGPRRNRYTRVMTEFKCARCGHTFYEGYIVGDTEGSERILCKFCIGKRSYTKIIFTPIGSKR